MSDYKYLICTKKESGLLEIILNRPELHNAFNSEYISEITDVFSKASEQSDLRLITLKSNGKSFCAGADLNWMSSMMNYSREENLADAQKLEQMFHAINETPVPVMCLVQGHTLGGGVGLVSVCDYVLANEKALFGFTEARLGLAPATIAPYVVSKIGVSQSRRWFVSGERFSADEALRMNLIHEVALEEDLEDVFKKRVLSFLKAGPMAARACKKVAKEFEDITKYKEMTCGLIADLRTSEQGQEGMKALLEKRKASWVQN